MAKVGNPNIAEAGKATRFPNKNQSKAGRPRSILTILKDSGYRKEDILIGNEYISSMTEPEIKEFADDKEKPVILRTFAKIYLEALKTGNYSGIKELMQYNIGIPKQTTVIEGAVTMPESFTLGNGNRNKGK